jgi:hypothetical protein
MKKIIIALIISGTSISTIYAQTSDTRGEFHLGLKAGMNYSNVYDSQGEDFVADAKVGFVAGGFLTIPIGSLVGFQPEILFSQKGFKGSGTLLGSPYQVTRTTNYLDIPLMLSIKPTRSVSLLAGPQFSFLLRQKDEFANGSASTFQIQEFENDNIRKNTLGFLLGADFNFDSIVLGTRLGWDIKNNNGDGTSTTPRYKNKWFQISLGFKI